MRWVMAVLFAAVFAMSLSVGAPYADAKGGKKACTSTSLLEGKKVTWKCKKGTKCCFDAVMGTGSCVDKSAICL